MDLSPNGEFSAYWGNTSRSSTTDNGSQSGSLGTGRGSISQMGGNNGSPNHNLVTSPQEYNLTRRTSSSDNGSSLGNQGGTTPGGTIGSGHGGRGIVGGSLGISLGTPSAGISGMSGSTPQTSVIDLPVGGEGASNMGMTNTLPSASTSGNSADNSSVASILDHQHRTHPSNTNTANNAGDGRGRITPFDPMDHARLSPGALDPSGFSRDFIMPRFVSGGPADPYGYGVAIAEPMASRDSMATTSMFSGGGLGDGSNSMYSSMYSAEPYYSLPSSSTGVTTSSMGGIASSVFSNNDALLSGGNDNSNNPDNNSVVPSSSTASSFQMAPSTSSHIYTPYGSSIVSVTTTPQHGSKLAGANPATLPSSSNPGTASSPFNPGELGLPIPPPPGTSTNFAGLYSSSGFDMISVLARVAVRPNQTIQIGPVDTSCAFLVVDAKKFDMPIVFASETFTKMTGYSMEEIMGRNCRFLQSPDGLTVQGQPRKYTDGAAAWHMRNHITAGKESQSSLINYMKGGKPFINLVTIVPIPWDTDEIAYYVGFQVDLVDQPSAIMDRMRDGTYVVNYSLFNNPSRALSMSTVIPTETEEVWPMEDISASTAQGAGRMGGGSRKMIGSSIGTQSLPKSASGGNNTVSGAGNTKGTGSVAAAAENMAAITAANGSPGKEELELIEMLTQNGVNGLDAETDKKQLNRLLLNNADDFIHVLSLKGSMLYCSPSSAAVLEYEPSELIGKTLQALCHPSDVVPVMRQLKDSSNSSQPYVSLLYRIRRKYSGYIWMEASGKLHIEPGKGRKCVILVGRPREVYKMSWNELRAAGGLGDAEFWMKLSPTGTILSSTASLRTVLGYQSSEVVGTSLLSMAGSEYTMELLHALKACEAGTPSAVRYRIRGCRDYIDVVTRFYPRNVDSIEDKELVSINMAPRHLSILAQTNEYSSEERKSQSLFMHQAPTYGNIISSGGGGGNRMDGSSSDSDSESSTSGANGSSSIFKTLTHPSLTSDNIFDELDTTRCTSWQYELHLLQNVNKKLRDEKEQLVSYARQNNVVLASLEKMNMNRRRGSSETSSKGSSGRPKSCGNCGRTDSPEWRAGPTKKKELCNACGLRWAKSQKGGSGGGGSINSPSSVASGDRGSDSPKLSPSQPLSASLSTSFPAASATPSSLESSESPMSWM